MLQGTLRFSFVFETGLLSRAQAGQLPRDPNVIMQKKKRCGRSAKRRGFRPVAQNTHQRDSFLPLPLDASNTESLPVCELHLRAHSEILFTVCEVTITLS